MGRTIVIIQCNWCDKEVEKTLKSVNVAHKHGRNMFCDGSCARKHQWKQHRDNFVMPVEKSCKGCGEIKLLVEFYSCKENLDGKRGRCKSCDKKWRGNNLTKIAAYHKKRMYGLTPEHEAERLESQGNVCAICGCLPPLCVDHDHMTGEIRGLLCRRCNSGLGFLGDNLEGILKVVAYLEKERNG